MCKYVEICCGSHVQIGRHSHPPRCLSLCRPSWPSRKQPTKFKIRYTFATITIMEHTQCQISPKDHISPLRAFCLCFSPSLQSFWRIFNSLLDCSKKKDLGPITEVVSRAMHVDGEKLSHSIEECFEKWENTLLLNFEDKVTFTQIHWRCCVNWKGWRCKVRAALVSGLWNNKELERTML